jgi:hypothetical protein
MSKHEKLCFRVSLSFSLLIDERLDELFDEAKVRSLIKFSKFMLGNFFLAHSCVRILSNFMNYLKYISGIFF